MLPVGCGSRLTLAVTAQGMESFAFSFLLIKRKLGLRKVRGLSKPPRLGRRWSRSAPGPGAWNWCWTLSPPYLCVVLPAGPGRCHCGSGLTGAWLLRQLLGTGAPALEGGRRRLRLVSSPVSGSFHQLRHVVSSIFLNKEKNSSNGRAAVGFCFLSPCAGVLLLLRLTHTKESLWFQAFLLCFT